jgi:hypothetical protein
VANETLLKALLKQGVDVFQRANLYVNFNLYNLKLDGLFYCEVLIQLLVF